MALNNMPNEVLVDIVHWAVSSGTPEEAGRLAAVNSTWQSIVEEKTFEHLRLKAHDLTEAMAILNRRPERFGLVRIILFQVVLTRYTRADCRNVETSHERFENDLAFTKDMNKLLTSLAEWPSTGKELELRLYSYSPTDTRILIGNAWHRFWFGIVQNDIFSNRWYGSTLEMYKTIKDPVPAITKLTMRDDCERFIAVSGIECLFGALKGLKDVHIRFWDIYKHDPESVRRLNRRRMAKMIEQMPSSVETMRLHVEYYPPADQKFKGQKTCDNDKRDALTVAFRNVSQKMKFIDIQGMLGTSELFWPAHIDAANPVPFWPKLERMVLYYHILEPSGDWIFEKDATSHPRVQFELPFYNLDTNHTPAEDIRPMQNRFTANQEKMDLFYTTIAKAVAQMPKLKYMRVQAMIYWSSVLVPFHVFEYRVMGHIGHAKWTGIPSFRVDDDVLKFWQKMAYERDLIMRFEWEELPQPL
ncbi:hypothetical protein F5Y19DRAFT_426457 [Xylariaceae sp. FL1651]|nr:hypothetical protein F5Y19DRAFT_426457 [Xylariaceae sp. FL1651]